MKSIQIKTWHKWTIGLLGFLLLLRYMGPLPSDLYEASYSAVLFDSQGSLMGARVADDGQWRFPPHGKDIPEKYKCALLAFEDKRFYYHLGVDPLAIMRASKQNIRAQRVVSGGSTISMQTISLYRGKKAESLWAKMREAISAIRLEFRFSKQSILRLYASRAPFGGNVVGLEAACWRYLGKGSEQLSWAEAAMLAVLPNSPSLIHPSKNRAALLKKRNQLLDKLLQQGILDSLQWELALLEPIPEKPHPLPDLSPHLLEWIRKKEGHTHVRAYHSTLDIHLQEKVQETAKWYHQIYQENNIHNMAIMVVHIPSGQVKAYMGNLPSDVCYQAPYVDHIRASRSPGSLLKPLLYQWMLEEGSLMPHELLPDVPVYMSGFRPENFYRKYDGAVPASTALQRSLNIPFALALKDYGIDKFLKKLQSAGFSGMRQSADHYGLSLVLGGVEVSLWELASVYRMMALAAMGYETKINQMHFEEQPPLPTQAQIFDRGSAWMSLQVLSGLQRPNEWGAWQQFESSRKISWKTGTSHGFRDAWSIGMDQNYLVGVWVGNASGEGRPGLIGAEKAAPVLFSIFRHLDGAEWFEKPHAALKSVDLCAQSGLVASQSCPIIKQDLPIHTPPGKICGFHQRVAIDQKSQLRTHANCSDDYRMESFFSLPPAQEHYFKQVNPHYKSLPDWDPACTEQTTSSHDMQWIYPKPGMILTLGSEGAHQKGQFVLKLAHKQANSKVMWFLDNQYLDTSQELHEIAIRPKPGSYRLSCVDDKGQYLEQNIRIQWTQ